MTDELLGFTLTGGLGTATSFLAVALGRMGHDVELLYTGGTDVSGPKEEWRKLYDDAGVRIRVLERSANRVEPGFLGHARDVESALAVDPPDVVVTQDLAAPAYTAIATRHLGLGFERTLFVVYCHGTRRWITDTARKVRVAPGAHAISIAEQASVELADAVVCPSAYVRDWMRSEGWELPQRTAVIPYVSRSAATGAAQPPPTQNGSSVRRIVFFGRLEERKGVRPFAEAVNAIASDVPRDVELEFLGWATPAWPPRRVERLLSDDAKRAFAAVSFHTDLDQAEALARLRRPGTLAVMPSFGETFSNAVYECLEHGIPFVASDAGAPRELVAAEDRARVLFEPTPKGIASALRRALANGDALRPVKPAFDAQIALDQWRELVAVQPEDRAAVATHDGVEVVVRGGETELDSGTSEWVVVLNDEDVPHPDLVETAVRAQAASGADVVTCGMNAADGTERIFLGDPGGLGLVANHYGVAPLIRRSLLRECQPTRRTDVDPDWVLLARVAVQGARIVSVPRALVAREGPVGDVDGAPADALLVAEAFEEQLPRALSSLARLTAGLAATPAGRQ